MQKIVAHFLVHNNTRTDVGKDPVMYERGMDGRGEQGEEMRGKTDEREGRKKKVKGREGKGKRI